MIDAFAQACVHEDETICVFHAQIRRTFREDAHEWVITLMLTVFGIASVPHGVLLLCGLFFSYLSCQSDPVACKVSSTANGGMK